MKARFDEQLARIEEYDSQIQSYQEQISAFEGKIQTLQGEKAEAISAENRMQSDLEDLKRSNRGFEEENSSLVKERRSN